MRGNLRRRDPRVVAGSRTAIGLSLEASVVLPLAVATLAILPVYRRYPIPS